MHTVFINDQPLRFVNAYDKREIDFARGHQLYSENDISIADLVSQMEKPGKRSEIFYLSDNADSSWKIFISLFNLIEAAGGLVKNNSEEYLIILRHQKWDLPKGKIEYDETPEQAAVREVEEECGISRLSILEKLPISFHTYTLKEKRMLKKNNWFLMHTESTSRLIPQQEEGIEEAKWLDQKTIRKTVLNNTYASIAEVLTQYFGWS